MPRFESGSPAPHITLLARGVLRIIDILTEQARDGFLDQNVEASVSGGPSQKTG